MKVNDKLAFISPYIAKKNEIDDPNNKGIVSYNLTFSHLTKYLRKMYTGCSVKMRSYARWKASIICTNILSATKTR